MQKTLQENGIEDEMEEYGLFDEDDIDDHNVSRIINEFNEE